MFNLFYNIYKIENKREVGLKKSEGSNPKEWIIL